MAATGNTENKENKKLRYKFKDDLKGKIKESYVLIRAKAGRFRKVDCAGISQEDLQKLFEYDHPWVEKV